MALENGKVAIRVLWRSPLFTLTAVVTIALGIGASTAIFSVTHAVLLQPLPYKDADRSGVCGDGIGWSGTVRCAGDDGAAPHRGNRRAHGTGGRTGKSVPVGGCPGISC